MTRNDGFVWGAPLIPAGAVFDGDSGSQAGHNVENTEGGDGEGDGLVDDGTDAVRDEELRKLHEEAKRWRRRCREPKGQMADAEVIKADVHALEVEKEFYRLAAQRVHDLGAAFKLADGSHVMADRGPGASSSVIRDPALADALGRAIELAIGGTPRRSSGRALWVPRGAEDVPISRCGVGSQV
jgi:hypothetical protein